MASATSAEPLFNTRMQDIDGQEISLARYRGKALIVNFWARWCSPCREEIPAFIQLQKVYRDKLQVIGIGLEDDAAAVKAFGQKYGINYPLLLAREQGIPLMRSLDNTRGALPYTLVINRQGQIVQIKVGLLHASELEKAAQRALQ